MAKKVFNGVPAPAPRCRVLRVAVPRGSLVRRVPMFLYVDRVPLRLPDGSVIIYAHPVPSVVVPTTAVSFVERFELEFRELETNYHVILKHERGAEHYVYPKKVWELVSSKYIEPLKRGRPPAEPGILFYGPPGTGKTSMMELMALGLGLHVVDIDPGHILSKWVGESLTYDEEVILFTEQGPIRCKIGELAEQDLKKYGEVYTYSFTRDGRCEIRRVYAVIKHPRTKRILRIKTLTGREIKVTDDHSLFTMDKRTGQLIEVKAGELKPGDPIAVPMKVTEPPCATNKIDLVKLAAMHAPDKFSVVFKESWSELREKLDADFYALTRRLGYSRVQSRWRLTQSLSINDYVKVKDILEKHGVTPIAIRSKGAKSALPVVLEIDEDVAWLMGLLLADGGCRPNKNDVALMISKNEVELLEKAKRVAERFGRVSVYDSKRGCYELVIFNASLANILSILGIYRYDRERRLHPILLSLPDKQLAALLRGYFDGDGCFENGKLVEASTVSRDLANDIAFALLRFGIVARISEKKTDKEHSWRIRILGYTFLERFAKHIGFTVKEKQAKLERYLERMKSSRMVRGPYIIVDEELAQLAEKKFKYKPSKIGLETMKRLIKQFGEEGLLEKLERSEVFWDVVEAVEEVEYDKPYVYDLSVEKNENFISGFGGIIAHNSEQRLLNKLREAEEKEPSIVRIDDAEWLVRRRDLAAASDTPGAYLTMLSILLQRIPVWKREGRRCLAAVATNVSPSAIDPALMRSGRLGKPVFIPLPDYEAIVTVLKVRGLKASKAEELARKLLAVGANMADVVAAAEDVKEGREPRIEEIEGRGYSRPFFTAELPVDWFPVKLARRSLSSFDRRVRLWVQLEESVAVPVAVALAHSCTRGAVVLEDPRYVDEAVLTAEVARSVLVVPTSMAEHVKFIHASSKAPIIYAGMDHPPGKAFPVVTWDSLGLSSDASRAVVDVVLSFYGIRCSGEVKEKLLARSRQKLREVLSNVPYLLAGGELTEEELQWWM